MWQRLYLIFWLCTVPVALAQQDEAPDSPIEDTEAAAVDGEAGDSDGQGAERSGAAGTGAIYLPLKPAFVVNYGGAGRLKFLKADISVRLEDAKAANSIRHHMPYIRNNLVMLFSAQNDESIGSQAGKEALRQEALREVRQVLLTEDHQEGVVDLYFESLIIQK